MRVSQHQGSRPPCLFPVPETKTHFHCWKLRCCLQALSSVPTPFFLLAPAFIVCQWKFCLNVGTIRDINKIMKFPPLEIVHIFSGPKCWMNCWMVGLLFVFSMFESSVILYQLLFYHRDKNTPYCVPRQYPHFEVQT